MIDYSLYLCTDSTMNKNYTIEDCVEQAIKGGVSFVQVREKNKTKKEIVELAKKIQIVTKNYNIPLVINDYVDIALELDADGVHLGQNDMSCTEARKLLGKDKIVGISVSNLEEAKKAIREGATYLGVGAIHKSKTKQDATLVDESELKKILAFSNIPVVVIGGINEQTIPQLKKFNIAGYAMIRPILGQDNIMKSAKQLKKLIKR